jgi:hypothetical protein
MSGTERWEVQEVEKILDLLSKSRYTSLTKDVDDLRRFVVQTQQNIDNLNSNLNSGNLPAAMQSAVSDSSKNFQYIMYFTGKITPNYPSLNSITWTAGNLYVGEETYAVTGGYEDDVETTWVIFILDPVTLTATVSFQADIYISTATTTAGTAIWGYYLGGYRLMEFVSERPSPYNIAAGGGQEVVYFSGIITPDSPSTDYISWTSGTLYARGLSYDVTAGDSGASVTDNWIYFALTEGTPNTAVPSFSATQVLSEDNLQWGYYVSGSRIIEFVSERQLPGTITFEKQIIEITDADVKEYVCNYIPITNSSIVALNGVVLYESLTEDYTISAQLSPPDPTIMWVYLTDDVTLTVGDKLLIQYPYYLVPSP